MKTHSFGLLLGLLAVVGACSGASSGKTAAASGDSTPTAEARMASIHSIKVTTLDGKPAELSQYKGQVLLVVNTASECGYTPQYEGLEKLYEGRKAKGLAVLGFPSNDFGGQEPGDAAQIQTFCTQKYGVTFPMFSKVVTKAGPDQSPVYTYLGGATGQLPQWNFAKYLVGKDGRPIAFYNSKVTPDDKELVAAIDKALAAN
jgi:glutathione peroxidase